MELQALYNIFKQYPAVSTDTRHILPDSLFFALKGANFNGNEFAEHALVSGARYVIIDEVQYKKDDRFILVDDVLKTLQALAHYHRQQFEIPFIGVTGTNGKTTTKELLNAVLSKTYKTYATKGNLNNHIGVPLTLLAIDQTIEIAIIEMGANHIGEIDFLCQIAAPTHGLISNVGKAHLEGFGSFEGVKKAKGELYDWLQDSQGTLFLQGDNPFLKEMAAQRHINKVVTYGFSESNAIIGRLIKANPLLQIEWHLQQSEQVFQADTQLTGSYNTENFLAAIALGHYFDVPLGLINEAISEYTPTNNRSQITKTDRNTVICDYYNANATSMEAALTNMGIIEAEQKVIILGDMFELGDESSFEHQKVVDLAKTIVGARLIFVGKAFYEHKDGDSEFFETTDDVKSSLSIHPISGATILLKASRGMAFEKLMEVL
ncbi:UDP-N-acetylmuramoyl-tripeptide--D-alanyl-D-alanine ligase [Sphingobacterium faecium]|uniref:UDP-N-acetylmuramoyl-tripeptide--D-alanyl-D- alanine ligase n=1 Tax=Sphingobacterium faecium TaxID=34087 RepID=UPI00097EC0E3|nr:UDP-N-acetylmuramoyl-tripeptide--D-alanyl-D-alanine ligase [Sphingobacterium faecium]WGQ16662.1 UDP-N-acetylmuramoyl-tripeptide--D-alanyl-D-alanine ligase [Sphingobacterium faecium]SJN33773.1 UDP-N-acetylmuramoylalanyl-D-glutamyl-2,6-diaminopimelate--D-alanyl-D-alanine ligase [Sphingobacterium faecium PCAi_F2.5]HCU45078.1 UDP-N-acetylmuramoyl-tripeptide--D-alanyl-D-alanine ligase [Sphingobacterium sp.]